MFYDVKVYAFVLVVALLAEASCAPTDSEKPNPILNHSCVKLCPITDDYNPSCGTDGQNYPTNSFYLCFENCKINISKAYDGRCNQRSNRSSQDSQTCLNSCPVTADYSPFCGSDGNTHPTHGLLHCYQHCGVGITMIRDGACDIPNPGLSIVPREKSA